MTEAQYQAKLIEPRIYQTVKQKEDFTVAHFNRIKHVLH